MSGTPQVSCIIATYNRRDRLLRAIESVQVQDGVALEILVCDDGSTDDTAAAVGALDDPRIRFIAGPHTGLPGAVRNRGIAVARGEWLAFLDDDDVWRRGKLRAQIDLMRETGLLAATTNAALIENGEILPDPYLRDMPDRGRIPFDTLVDFNCVVGASAVFHRSLLARVRGFADTPGFGTHEDYALWLRVATFTDFVYLDERMLIYNVDSPDSVRRDRSRFYIATQQFRVLANYIAWALRERVPGRFVVRTAWQIVKILGRHAAGFVRNRHRRFRRWAAAR